MIITEKLTINGRAFIKTYSDQGCMVERNGAQYAEAIDPEETGRTYTETAVPVEGLSEIEEKAQAYDILMGVQK